MALIDVPSIAAAIYARFIRSRRISQKIQAPPSEAPARGAIVVPWQSSAGLLQSLPTVLAEPHSATPGVLAGQS